MIPIHLLVSLVVAAAEDPASHPAKEIAHGTMKYITVDSPSLDDDDKIDVGVYLPPGYEGSEQRYPSLYFLHGMNGSEHKWADRGANRQLDELVAAGRMVPTIVVCPDGRNSMYVNWINGKSRWEDFIAKDLVAAIDAQFRTEADPKKRGVNGDSMGGYGSLLVGLDHPEVFGSVSAHSAALYSPDPAKLPEMITRRGQNWKDIFGYPIDAENWKKNNPLEIAQTRDVEQLKKSFIYFDVGKEDRFGFFATCGELDKILTDRGVPHRFLLREGNHGAEYYEEYVEFSFVFHGRAFSGQDPYAGDYETKTVGATPAEQDVEIPKELGIEDLVVGTGAEALNGKKVDVLYSGKLTDGQEFDSSLDRDKPYTFEIGKSRLIKGMHLGVIGMKEGGKRKLTVPPELAYGARGRGAVPPNATLVFEIELIKVH